MSHDIPSSNFRDVGVIVPQSMLDKCEKEVLLFDILGARKKLVTTLKRMLAIVYTLVEDLAFFLI